MFSRCFLITMTFLTVCSQYVLGANVGLLIMATGKYIKFIPPLIESAENHFCKGHEVTYFVFTDSEMPPTEHIVWIHQDRLGWPFDTMMRFHAYAAQKDLLSSQDYLFCLDADMLFVDAVGEEIFSERVATQHPGFVGQRGSYETNPASNACIRDDEGEQYFAGGFYGGSAEEVLCIAQTNAKNIDDDLMRGLIAVWHDESHLNRYFADNKPTKILTPSYCYPESWVLPYEKRLLALDKNHNECRELD